MGVGDAADVAKCRMAIQNCEWCLNAMIPQPRRDDFLVRKTSGLSICLSCCVGLAPCADVRAFACLTLAFVSGADRAQRPEVEERWARGGRARRPTWSVRP